MNELINLDLINRTLDNYPNLKTIFGKIDQVKEIYTYPYRENKTVDYEWNFFGILNSEDFSDDLIEKTRNNIKSADGVLEIISFSSYLNHISFKKRILERLNFLVVKLDNIYSREQFKTGLINNPFSFLSELEFANFCLDSDYKIIEAGPKLNSGKKLDFKINLNGKRVLIEVITPRLKLSMLQKPCGFFSISCGIENNLNAEFKHHEIDLNDIKDDFIIVIDGDYAGIDEINLISAIEEFINDWAPKAKFLKGIYLKKGKTFSFFPIKNKKY